MLHATTPDRIRIAFDDRADPSGHPRPAPRTARTGPQPSRPWPRPGAGQHRRQDDDPGGDCIDAAAVLRTVGAARALGGTAKAPSTLGTFLRSFK